MIPFQRPSKKIKSLEINLIKGMKKLNSVFHKSSETN